MPNSEGKIYVDRTVTPARGISVRSDIAYVLGRRSNDVGHLCGDTTDPMTNAGGTPDEGGKINKWAKFKPTRMHGINPTDSWRGEIITVFGHGGLYNCGLNIQGYTSLADFKAAVDAQNFGWQYQPPRGRVVSGSVVNEFFRVLDFDKYYHKSSSPFLRLEFTQIQDPSSVTEAVLYGNLTGYNDALGLKDIPAVAMMYFGAAIYKSNGTFVGFGTAQTTIGNGDNTNAMRFQLTTPSAEGSYVIIPLLSLYSQAYAEVYQLPDVAIITLPFGGVSFEVVNGSARVVVDTAYMDWGDTASARYVDYDYYLYARRVEQTTFRNVQVLLGIIDNGGQFYTLFTIPQGDKTVSGGGSYHGEGRLSYSDIDIDKRNDFYSLYTSGGKVAVIADGYPMSVGEIEHVIH